MTSSTEDTAPELGEPEDVTASPKDAAAARSSGDVAEDAEKTIETPDELGGTGGEQAGGAG